MLTWFRAGLFGFAAAVATFVACGTTPSADGGIDAGQVPASEPPLAGRIVHRFASSSWGRNGGSAHATCDGPTNGTLLGGKCSVIRTNDLEVGGPWVPRLIATGYCEGIRTPITYTRTEEHCCAVGTNLADDSEGIVTAVAICLYPPGKVPPEQPQPTF